MDKFVKEQIDDLLRVFDLRVVFTKVDGSERFMECTRDLDKIPLIDHPKDTGSVKVEFSKPDEVVRVYDVNAEGWRSIKVNSIKNLEII